jgi:hypothetical protein
MAKNFLTLDSNLCLMRKIKIFLASSSELKNERDQFELLIGRENKRWVTEGVFLELVIWEDFRARLSADGMQAEYNLAVQQADIFVMLFFSKVGPHTKAEFDAALSSFRERGKPHIYTYYKDAPMQLGGVDEADLLSLLDFRRTLSQLGHYPTVYPSTDWMLLHFRRQLEDHLRGDGLTQPELPDAPPGDQPGQRGGNPANPGDQKNPSDVASRPDDPKRILFLAASPRTEAHLQTAEEFRSIRTAMRRGQHREAFQFMMPEMAVEIEDVVRAMSIGPQIVHFSGHGRQEGIQLSDSFGGAVTMPVAALKRLFRPLKNVTELVLLNACYSAEQAEEISKFGMYVVGHSAPISDTACIAFAKGLYTGLGEGKPFEEALNDAMIVLIVASPKAADGVEVWKDGERLEL